MATQRVQRDQWTWLIDGRLRFFNRIDPLMPDDPDDRPAIDFGIDPDHEPGWELLEIRTRAPLLAGWRIQFAYPKRLLLPRLRVPQLSPIDTNEFRRPDEGDFR